MDGKSAINAAGKTPFKINGDVLALLTADFEADESEFFGVFNRAHPNSAAKTLSTLNAAEKAEVMQHNNKYRQYHHMLITASLFNGINFYLPMFADYRGRIYPLAPFLNYQLGDPGRALISFTEGTAITKEA